MSHHLPDATKMISDTPRMKAAQMAAMEHMTGDVYRVGCDIEQQLNAANVEIDEKRKDIVYLATEKAKLENYVMRLEEAGDDLYANCDPSRWDSTATAARKLSEQNAWLKGKEAKL